MKKLLPVLLFVLAIAIVLCIGAVRGWSGERADIVAMLEQGGELRELAEKRAMDAHNLGVIAARYLPAEDEDLLALEQASQAILNGLDDAADLLRADDALTAAALRLAERLPSMPDVTASSRDSAYIGALTTALNRKSGVSLSYQQLADNFNSRLSSTLMGSLADLLGTDPIEIPTAE